MKLGLIRVLIWLYPDRFSRTAESENENENESVTERIWD